MQAIGWKVKDISGGGYALRALYKKAYPSLYDDCHLLVRMAMFGGNQRRSKAEAAQHNPVSHHQLTLNALRHSLARDRGPIQVLRQQALLASPCLTVGSAASGLALGFSQLHIYAHDTLPDLSD